MAQLQSRKSYKDNCQGMGWIDWLNAAGINNHDVYAWPLKSEMTKHTKYAPLYKAWQAGEDPTDYKTREKITK